MIIEQWVAVLLLAAACRASYNHPLYDFASQGSKGWTGISHHEDEKLDKFWFHGSMEWRTGDGPPAFITCSGRKTRKYRQFLRSPLIGWQEGIQISIVMSNTTEWMNSKLDVTSYNCTVLTVMFVEADSNGVVYDSKLVPLASVYSGGFEVNLTTHQSAGQFIFFSEGCGCSVIRNFRVYTREEELPPQPSKVVLPSDLMVVDEFQIGMCTCLGLLVCGFAVATILYIRTNKKLTSKNSAMANLLRHNTEVFSCDEGPVSNRQECVHATLPQYIMNTEDMKDSAEIGNWLDDLGFYCYHPNFMESSVKSWQDVFDLTYIKLNQMDVKAEHQCILLHNITVLKSRRRFYYPTPWYGYF